MIETWDELFAVMDGPAGVADAIGVTPRHASQMKWRQSIRSEYWADLVESAKVRRVEGVDFKTLASLAAKSRKQREAAPQ